MSSARDGLVLSVILALFWGGAVDECAGDFMVDIIPHSRKVFAEGGRAAVGGVASGREAPHEVHADGSAQVVADPVGLLGEEGDRGIISQLECHVVIGFRTNGTHGFQIIGDNAVWAVGVIGVELVVEASEEFVLEGRVFPENAKEIHETTVHSGEVKVEAVGGCSQRRARALSC